MLLPCIRDLVIVKVKMIALLVITKSKPSGDAMDGRSLIGRK